MMARRTFIVVLPCLVMLAGFTIRHPQATPPSARMYRIDPARSRFVVEVGKTGAFSFMAGHTHEIETNQIAGTIHDDSDDPARSSVQFQIDAASLRVTGKGDPPDDVPKVQETMLGEKVLDVTHYPTIAFESTTVTRATADASGRADAPAPASTLAVSGRLTIHGATQSLTVPIAVRLDGDILTATGATTIKQTDYGITPISVAGVVKVKDALAISFTVVAMRE